jgi:hypothetical protein
MTKVLVYRVDQGPAEEEVEDFEAMRAIVGGPVEGHAPPGFPPGVLLYLNEDGKACGLPVNRKLHMDGRAYDVVVGDFLATACDQEGAARDLTEQEIEFIKDYFS